jgi:hypothetical protein
LLLTTLLARNLYCSNPPSWDCAIELNTICPHSNDAEFESRLLLLIGTGNPVTNDVGCNVNQTGLTTGRTAIGIGDSRWFLYTGSTNSVCNARKSGSIGAAKDTVVFNSAEVVAPPLFAAQDVAATAASPFRRN